MTLTLTGREQIRDALKVLVDANLQASPTTSSKPVFVTFSHQPDTEELDGKSPYMFIASGPAKRESRAIAEKVRGEIMLLVGVGIRVGSTAANALSDPAIEDKLDKIEQRFFEMLFNQTNHSTDDWQWVELEGTSFVGYERKGNDIYRVEAWNLLFRTND